MSDGRSQIARDADHEIPPRQYFDASPTWFAWNKLTIKDLHALREESGFAGQNVYFHHNHPIKYVVVVGTAIEIELGGGSAASKLCFISIDDGTEHILNVKIMRRSKEESDSAAYPSNTMIDDLDVVIKLGQKETIFLKGRELMLGSVVRARGTIETFRGVRQMVLDGLKLIRTTSAEVQHWKKLIQWKRTVLDKPWILTEEERQRIDKHAERKRKAVARQERHDRRHARRQKHDLANQVEQGADGGHRLTIRRAADENEELEAARLATIFDEGALNGSDRIKAPWA